MDYKSKYNNYVTNPLKIFFFLKIYSIPNFFPILFSLLIIFLLIKIYIYIYIYIYFLFMCCLFV